MWNQHPGPLDPGSNRDFGGKRMFGIRVHHAVLNFYRTVGLRGWTEATAHRVAVELDKGAILNSHKLIIRPEHNPVSLQAELLPIEHEVQILTLLNFISGALFEKPRTEPLVKKEHRFALEMAKTQACMMWPKG